MVANGQRDEQYLGLDASETTQLLITCLFPFGYQAETNYV